MLAAGEIDPAWVLPRQEKPGNSCRKRAGCAGGLLA
jgi:hypothetical protein